MDWITLLQTFGLAVTMLAFIAWCAIRVAKWAGPRMDLLLSRMFRGLDDIEKFSERLAQAEDRISLLWEFQLRRAKVEVLTQGIAVRNSPIKIKPGIEEWLGDLAVELKNFYRKLGREMTETQLAEEIERRYGKELVEKLCIPHGLFQGACLIIAMDVAKSALKEDKEVHGESLRIESTPGD